jgi:hypothetical protein
MATGFFSPPRLAVESSGKSRPPDDHQIADPAMIYSKFNNLHEFLFCRKNRLGK